MNEKDITEIKVALATIQTQLEAIPELKEDLKATSTTLNEAHNRSIQNEKDIASINDRLRWLTRTVSGTIIVAIVGAVITLL